MSPATIALVLKILAIVTISANAVALIWRRTSAAFRAAHPHINGGVEFVLAALPDAEGAVEQVLSVLAGRPVALSQSVAPMASSKAPNDARRGLLSTLLLLPVVGLLARCSAPQPGSDAGVPAWQATVGAILAYCATQLRAVMASGYPAVVTGAASAALSEVTAAQDALAVVVAAQGARGICAVLYPAVQAVVNAAVGVLQAMTTAGIVAAAPLVVAVEAGGSILSQMEGVVCPVSADAGAHLTALPGGYSAGTYEHLTTTVLPALRIPAQPLPASLTCPRIVP